MKYSNIQFWKESLVSWLVFFKQKNPPGVYFSRPLSKRQAPFNIHTLNEKPVAWNNVMKPFNEMSRGLLLTWYRITDRACQAWSKTYFQSSLKMKITSEEDRLVCGLCADMMENRKKCLIPRVRHPQASFSTWCQHSIEILRALPSYVQ